MLGISLIQGSQKMNKETRSKNLEAASWIIYGCLAHAGHRTVRSLLQLAGHTIILVKIAASPKPSLRPILCYSWQ